MKKESLHWSPVLISSILMWNAITLEPKELHRYNNTLIRSFTHCRSISSLLLGYDTHPLDSVKLANLVCTFYIRRKLSDDEGIVVLIFNPRFSNLAQHQLPNQTRQLLSLTRILRPYYILPFRAATTNEAPWTSRIFTLNKIRNIDSLP